MSFDSLAVKQEELGENIKKVFSGFKKAAIIRRTTDFTQERVLQANQLWQQFTERHMELLNLQAANKNHPYFEKDYYNLIKEGYESNLAELQQHLLKLTSDADVSIQRNQRLIDTLRTTLRNISSSNMRKAKEFCQTKIKSIEKYWNEIQEFYDGFNMNEQDIETYCKLQEDTEAILIDLNENLNKMTAGSTSLNTTSSAVATTATKLPQISLPKFDGNYLNWRQFYDLFTELIHNQDMTECQKLWYLKTSLTGEAEKLIRHLTISEANYQAAWKMIIDRYENPRLLVSAFLNKLLCQPTVTVEHASSIRTLHDTTQECLLGLQGLGIQTEHWDPIVVHILLGKLDRSTLVLYEQSLQQPRSLQSLKEVLAFIENRFHSLEAIGTRGRAVENSQRKSHAVKSFASTIKSSCICCKEIHLVFACPKFLQLKPHDRLAVIRKAGCCINCLKIGHRASSCLSRGCKLCQKKHNTLLHLEGNTRATSGTDLHKAVSNQAESQSSQASLPVQQVLLSGATCNENGTTLITDKLQTTEDYVFLGTALVRILNDQGMPVNCRAVLDAGSQTNFITKRIVKRLNLKEIPDERPIEGIGQVKQTTQNKVSITIQSVVNGFSARLDAQVMNKIVSNLPTRYINTTHWPIPSNIKLADPQFNQPHSIDILIGCEHFYKLLSIGQIKLGSDLPLLQNTLLGWIVAGKATTPSDEEQLNQQPPICGINVEGSDPLDQQLEKFWALEELSNRKNNNWTKAEKRCETHFLLNTTRTTSGRFEVRLPFTEDPAKLGNSKDIAYKRLLALERKLHKDSELKQQYVAFMKEYCQLGHMEPYDYKVLGGPHYFLPHHCVTRPDSSTTKLRVVFDASAKTSTNLSLNDILASGPSIQDDVFSILLRFRMFRYAFTADIEKMYRQISVNKQDRKYQLILWRDHEDMPVQCFQLKTVTYGTTSAPYLAIRCLRKLAEDEGGRYPLGASALTRNFYVDDVLSGAKDLPTAIQTKQELQTILQGAGFRLRKWCSNHPRLIDDISIDDKEIPLDFNDGTEDCTKTVGLIWLPKSDKIGIRTSQLPERKITKRTALSDIAQLFDPLGLLTPVIITAKIFLQQLWKLKLDWDASLPQELHTTWSKFRQDLSKLNNVRVDRHIYSHQIPKKFQVHIFADASEKAYGAAAYIRSVCSDDIIRVNLLCSKSRVAPCKQQPTLPRLELCAAKVAAELAQRIKQDLNISPENFFLWSDSEVTLNWINSTSSSFHTFVANRISTIQELTSPQQWRHVRSEENPADVLSRGLSPEKLQTAWLWFYGPRFLHGEESLWPAVFKRTADCGEERRGITLTSALSIDKEHFLNTIDHQNSFRRLQHITAYIFRYIRNSQSGNKARLKPKGRSFELSAKELCHAEVFIIKHMQNMGFSEDMRNLTKYGEVPNSSSLSSLTPFLDEERVIRVGGRLEASSLPFDAKHPMLLPYNSTLTKLLLSDLHRENKHLGPQALLSMARQRYWPIKGKTLARSVVQNCVICARAKPRLMTQIMGNLPARRVTPARPFVNSGVDFCGPFWTHFKIRGKKPQKSYIAVFCCFATKATHLEVVADLTTDGFIGALKNFTGRRGICQNLYCDNATNFTGARNQLQEIREAIETSGNHKRIVDWCLTKGTQFHFIPPRAPHFAGLMEAAVKSAKHLLTRTLSSASLTYQELETLVIEIEAILNSRPLTPMSTDPNDLAALTPGHFLIGEPLTNSIHPDATEASASLAARWRIINQMKFEFWRRWTNEYLNQLQHRYKWKTKCRNVQPNTMVIIKDENTPPLKWPLGRIVKTYQGEDGAVRVADVKTASGVFRRAIHKLAPLPLENDSQSLEEPTKMSSSSEEELPDEENVIEDNTVPRKRSKLSLGSALTSLLFVMTMFSNSNANEIKVKPFKNQPGIYFEGLGRANIVTSRWNIIAYYNLKDYWKEIEVLSYCRETMDKLCYSMIEKADCHPVIGQFQHLADDIQRSNELLKPHQVGSRKRRGAVNVVGNVANTLFGILDSKYAEEMSATINNIKNNENKLLELFKNQTSILDSTVNIVKRSEETTTAQIDRIAKHLEYVSTRGRQSELTALFTTVAVKASIIVSTVQQIQGSILMVLTNSHHGTISPLLISPSQLRRELAKIKEQLPPMLKVPIVNNDTLNIYKLMTVQGRITNTHVVFKLTLPLTTPDEFELLKLTAIPTLVNHTFWAINPSSPFLMVNLHRDRYMPMTGQEINACIKFEEDRYLCSQEHPLFRRESGVASCEIELLIHATHNDACRVKQLNNGPHWTRLIKPNQWMFAVQGKQILNTVCNRTTTQFVIEGSGILEINHDCIINQDVMMIQGHHTYPTAINTSYIPTTNLTDTFRTQPQKFQGETIKHYTTDFEALQAQIKLIKKSTLEELRPHDIHQFSIGYLGLFCVFMISLGLLWKRCIKYRNTSRFPVPSSRTHGKDMAENPRKPDSTFETSFE